MGPWYDMMRVPPPEFGPEQDWRVRERLRERARLDPTRARKQRARTGRGLALGGLGAVAILLAMI